MFSDKNISAANCNVRCTGYVGTICGGNDFLTIYRTGELWINIVYLFFRNKSSVSSTYFSFKKIAKINF